MGDNSKLPKVTVDLSIIMTFMDAIEYIDFNKLPLELARRLDKAKLALQM